MKRTRWIFISTYINEFVYLHVYIYIENLIRLIHNTPIRTYNIIYLYITFIM